MIKLMTLGKKQKKIAFNNLYYSGFRRIFAGLFIVIFISVNAGNFILYTFFSRALAEEIKNSRQQMLASIKNTTELIYEEIISLATQLGHGNITLTRLMFQNTRDRILEFQSHQIMQNTLASFPRISYIAVYNERLDIIIGTKDFISETEAELKALVNRYFKQGVHNLTIPLTVHRRAVSSDLAATNTVTVIVYSPLSFPGDKGALLVGIYSDYFQQLIQRVDDRDLETVMIFHGNGELITSTETDRQLNIRKNEFVNELLGNKSGTGFYITAFEGARMFVSFSRSEILGWTFVSMVPYREIAARLILLRNMTFILTFIILCIGLFISYLMAINMHKPVRDILKRFNYIPEKLQNKKTADMQHNHEINFIEKQLDYLNSAVEVSEPLIKNTFILDFLKNQYIDINSPYYNNQVITSVFTAPYYLVCIFSIDEEEQSNGKEHINNRNALQKIAAEFLEKISVTVDTAALSHTDIAVILHLEIGAFPDGLIPLIRETSEMAKKLGGFSISVSVGSIVNSIYAINDSFEEAESGLKERFFQGEGTIVTGMAARTAEKGRREIAPPGAGELYQSLLSEDILNIQNALDKLICAFEQTTYEYAKVYLNTVIMDILSLCLTNKLQVDANSFHNLARQLQKAQTLKKVSVLLSRFFLDLAGNGIKKNSIDSSSPLIQDAVKLVYAQYGDPLFSINTAAESFNITPAYFNRIFKKEHQISYSEFLNEYRIEKACELIRTTNKSIIDIASAVGINNTTYFYTLFKKIHNMTPQQFRSKSRR